MKAIVLAAGRGSRMGEGTVNNPKCMMKLWGKPLLEHCLGSLQKSGFSLGDIGIVTGYKKEMINVQSVNYFHNPNWEKTNMFMSLTMAANWLRSEPCIVSYSDILFSPNAVKKLMESERDISITYYTEFWELWAKRFDNPLDDLETFKQQGGHLLEIGKKPVAREDIQGQYMGLLRIEPSGWKKIEQTIMLPMSKPVEKLDMTTLLQHLISLGHSVEVLETSDLWLECDNENDIAAYENLYSHSPYSEFQV